MIQGYSLPALRVYVSPHNREDIMQSEKRPLWRKLVFGRGGPVPEAKEMTRGQQTAWIIIAMVVVAVVAINYLRTSGSSDPKARCDSIFESNRTACRAAIAVERLNS